MILTASEPNSNQRKQNKKQINRNLEQEQNVDVGGKTQKGDEIWKLFIFEDLISRIFSLQMF